MSKLTLKGYVAGGSTKKSGKGKKRPQQTRLEKFQEERVRKKLQARYDAAQTTTENQRHWSNADDKVPTLSNTPAVRQRLRMRARYEWENNCICSGMVSTRSTDIIGHVGPRLQVQTDDAELNRYIEEEWKKWSDHPFVNLPAKLKILDEGKQVEGEQFLALQRDSEIFDSIGYQLGITVLSANRIAAYDYINGIIKTGNPDNPLEGMYSDDGVIIDPRTGRAKFYNVTNPYDVLEQAASLTKSKTLIPSRYILHWFTPRRAGQFRGYSELTPTLPLFAQMRRYVLATLTAAETAAMLAGIMKTNAPVAEPTVVNTWQKTELERGTLLTLPEGWDAEQFKPEQPIASFEMFIYCLAREIGRALNIPVGVVLGDSSKYNFASARLDYGWYEEQLRFYRNQLIIRVLDPLFNEWLIEFLRADPRVNNRFARVSDIKRMWQFEKRPSVNPIDDAKASTERLTNGTSTLAIECANLGQNWEDVLEQREKENQKIPKNPLDNGTDSAIMEEVNTDVLMAVISKALTAKYPLEATAKLVQLTYPRANVQLIRELLGSLYGCAV